MLGGNNGGVTSQSQGVQDSAILFHQNHWTGSAQISNNDRYNEDYTNKVHRAMSNGNLTAASNSIVRGIVQLNPRLSGAKSLVKRVSKGRKKSTGASASMTVGNVAMIHQTLTVKPNLKNVYSSVA
jgi:hypothetical protein